MECEIVESQTLKIQPNFRATQKADSIFEFSLHNLSGARGINSYFQISVIDSDRGVLV